MTFAAALRMPAWRVMTWNLHGSAEPDLALVARVIAGATPDVVALQEVRHRQARRIAGRLGWHAKWVFKHNPYTVLMWWRAEGLAIIAPWPLDDVCHATLSVEERRRSFRRRVAIGATVRRHAGDALRVYDTHLATDSPLTRLGQARRLAEHVAAEAPPAAIIAGDLNAHDEVELLRTFAAVGVVDIGGDDTSPAAAPVQRIDYVLVPANAEVLDRRTPAAGLEWADLSDHLPTLVEFTLP